MTITHKAMSSAAQRVCALLEQGDSISHRIALCWALSFAVRERRGGKETASNQILAARCTASRCRTLHDVLAQTRHIGYVCDAVDRPPSQLPDAAFPLVVLTADGTSLVLTGRSYNEGKEMYAAVRVESSGRQFGASIHSDELMAMKPGLSLVLLPLNPRKSNNQERRHGEQEPVADLNPSDA